MCKCYSNISSDPNYHPILLVCKLLNIFFRIGSYTGFFLHSFLFSPVSKLLIQHTGLCFLYQLLLVVYVNWAELCSVRYWLINFLVVPFSHVSQQWYIRVYSISLLIREISYLWILSRAGTYAAAIALALPKSFFSLRTMSLRETC